MTKTTVYLDDADLRRIKRMSRERGMSEAALIREAVARLARSGSERPRPRSLGCVAGPGNLAARTDELLQGFGTDGTDR